MNPDSGDVAIGIDIGGTKVSGGLVGVDGSVIARARRDTPHRSTAPRVVENVMVEVIQELLAGAHGQTPVAVGVGAAGFVTSDRSTVAFAPHLSWRQEPLRRALTDRVSLPVFIDNDANAACWAESRFGAARNRANVVMVNLGTGIGGAILAGGKIQRGEFGIAGEFGHLQMVPDGHRCECGNRGCWEQYASGNALVREARSMIVAGSPLAADLATRAGADPAGLTGPMITQAAHDGDATAAELLAEIGTWLGVGLANLANAFDPGLFVIGGGVSAAGELLLGPAREMFGRSLTGRGYRPQAEIVQANLGNEAGLIGAADLARRGDLDD
ncbi:MAG: ROK family glucokinase [Allobranchiibius sp.]